VVLYSAVRSGGSLGFVNDLRRLNVALTRARHALFVVGSEASLSSSSDWAALLQDARERGSVRNVTLSQIRRASAAEMAKLIPVSLLDGSSLVESAGQPKALATCKRRADGQLVEIGSSSRGTR
jgi:ATP-dependent exoDNAse (exonuclease V) beta subunit